MFGPLGTVNGRFVADKAHTIAAESLIEPRSLFPHFHGPGTGRSMVTEHVHSALKTKMLVALFFLFTRTLVFPIGFHIITIVGVTMLFKLGAF